ncbi:MAG: hypothetical protein C4K48_03170 [Candidatus Thorarchaeota archaeon]|nr:MAG: hypothetical protein C4K48_03170 [Candidatus Thorarchaeota archaeon]
MASSWVLKTRQASEAGKEILLREALVAHMRSTRDRQLFTGILTETRPLKDVFSFFASFYLHSYQGIRLLEAAESPELTADGKDDLGQEERHQLELEVRKLFGDKQREEIHTTRIMSELAIRFCDELGGKLSSSPDLREKVLSLLNEYLQRIPSEYSPNHDIDFVVEVTGWGTQWRDELYTKASGLKESALSLREELLRDHPSEVPETTVLRMGLERIHGRAEFARGRLSDAIIPSRNWDGIADAIIGRFCRDADEVKCLKQAHEIRLALLKAVEEKYDTPTTIEDYEQRLGSVVAGPIADILSSDSSLVLGILSSLLAIDSDELKAQLRRKGIDDLSIIGEGLRALADVVEDAPSGPQISKQEMELLERSLKTLEKLEHTLEHPVKGLLKARGLRASELDKISVDLLVKDRKSLVGIEVEVLDELAKKMRVPPPEEVKRLVEIRGQVKSGALSTLGISSARDFSRQRVEEETVRSIKLDIIWHLTTSILTNLTRIVESYIRSKQDLLRVKALLKSIYEDTDPSLQFLREEILVDLAAMRIHEFKVVHPELDTANICTWMHARLSSKDMTAARKDLDATPSPAFEGIIDKPLEMSGLEYDNYAIAFDIMQRFLKQERLEKLAKDEYAFETKQKEQILLESKRESLDVLTYLHNKAQTVFRAIGRVGTKGLEWSQSDTSKCSNLLAYYIKTGRGRLICSACGTVSKEKKCPQHGTSFIKEANDMDNLAIFMMRANYEIKDGLVGRSAEQMPWDKAKSSIEREIGILKRKGKLTSKANLKELLPGEINYVIGPVICEIIGKYFNESLVYAARRAEVA